MNGIAIKMRIINLMLGLACTAISVSCEFFQGKDYSMCIERQWTSEEKVLFDSLQQVWNFDSIVIHRTNFNECDENGFYGIHCYSKAIITKESEMKFKLMSDSIVTSLYSNYISTRVGAVVMEYTVTWELDKIVKGNGYERVTFGPKLFYKKESLEDYTGTRFEGDYHGNDFTRYSIDRTSDTLAWSGNLKYWR